MTDLLYLSGRAPRPGIAAHSPAHDAGETSLRPNLYATCRRFLLRSTLQSHAIRKPHAQSAAAIRWPGAAATSSALSQPRSRLTPASMPAPRRRPQATKAEELAVVPHVP